jgi:hypothetical protein
MRVIELIEDQLLINNICWLEAAEHGGIFYFAIPPVFA